MSDQVDRDGADASEAASAARLLGAPVWKCLGCGSVCSSDPAVKPAPCDHCGSDDICRYEDAPEDAPEDVIYAGDLSV